MSKPLVSVIWLNYNSSKLVNIALKSLEAISAFEVPFELIVVDNNSTDSSFEIIKNFLMKLDLKYLKIIKAPKNLGYTGGNNLGYLYSDKRTKYIVLINNDLIPDEDSISDMVKFMEEKPSIGALQGVIFHINGKTVENAGFLCSEGLVNHPIKEFPKKPIEVTYASGAYLIIRKSAIDKIGKLFDWHGFMYFDDWPLGYRIWMHGYKVIVLPVVAGRHLGGGSGGVLSPRTLYYMYRGLAMIIELSNSRFKKIIKATILKRLPLRNSIKNPSLIKASVNGLRDGFSIGNMMRKQGEVLDIYAAPLVKGSPLREILFLYKGISKNTESQSYIL